MTIFQIKEHESRMTDTSLKWKERKTFLQNIGSRENERET